MSSPSRSSSHRYNRSDLATVTVAVITGNTRLAVLPGNVAIPSDLGSLDDGSMVNVTQIATVDRDALETRIGTLPDWLTSQVDAGLGRALGLTRT